MFMVAKNILVEKMSYEVDYLGIVSHGTYYFGTGNKVCNGNKWESFFFNSNPILIHVVRRGADPPEKFWHLNMASGERKFLRNKDTSNAIHDIKSRYPPFALTFRKMMS